MGGCFLRRSTDALLLLRIYVSPLGWCPYPPGCPCGRGVHRGDGLRRRLRFTVLFMVLFMVRLRFCLRLQLRLWMLRLRLLPGVSGQRAAGEDPSGEI